MPKTKLVINPVTGKLDKVTVVSFSAFTDGSIVFALSGDLAEDNANLFWDDTNNRLGIGINSGFDARTGLSILGDLDIIHTAIDTDDHAFELDLNADGFGDVKAIDIVYITGTLSAGEDTEVILVNIDESAATGGDVAALEVLATEGNATIFGLEVGIGVAPVEQLSGTFGDMDSALVNVTDRLAEFISTGSNIEIFSSNGDTVTIGNTEKFEEIEFLLVTPSSGAGIKPTFEFSNGSGFTSFTPTDGTNGLRNNGVMLWLDSDIPTWAKNNSEFLIKITRTRNNISTPPVESKVQIGIAVEYKWDKDGDVSINSLTTASVSPKGATWAAVAMVCDNGATFPTSGITTGQWFLHTPTGRKILYQYDSDAAEWKPIISFGSMTLYVDNTDGTDDMDGGFGVDSDAFKTPAFAFTIIPGTVGGNVMINFNAETYTVNEPTLAGKNLTDPAYTITLQGVLTSLLTGTATGKTIGSGATPGSLTHAGQFGSYDNKLLYIATEDLWRIIDSDTSDVITPVRIFTDATNKDYTIYGWGTVFAGGANRALAVEGQVGIIVRNIKFTSTSTTGIRIKNDSFVTCFGCSFETSIQVQFLGLCDLFYCVVTTGISTYAIVVQQYSKLITRWTKIYGASNDGVLLDTYAQYIPLATVIDGFGDGVHSTTSVMALQNIPGSGFGYNEIRNCANGMHASSHGIVTGKTNTIYINISGTDELADSAHDSIT